MVLCKQVLWGGHGLELKRIPAWILEEHCPLLPGHPLKSQVRLNHERNSSSPDAPRQLQSPRKRRAGRTRVQHQRDDRHRFNAVVSDDWHIKSWKPGGTGKQTPSLMKAISTIVR